MTYRTMDLRYFCTVILLVPSLVAASAWNNQNCPAPRAPDNGLSFIFRNGELVHFRCHPGYIMRGKPVAYCVNNVWTETAPECLPIQKWPMQARPENDIYHYKNRNYDQKSHTATVDYQRQLFSWGDKNDDRKASRQGAYGDGPRRLPLINGIWPSQNQKEQVLALGPQSTPGPKTMVKEEIDIAELRHKQLEELKQQRYTGEKRQRNKNKKYKKHHFYPDEKVPRETIVSLGSTKDGDAISIAFAKQENQIARPHPHHRKRHYNHRGKNIHGKKYKIVHPTDSGFIISRSSRVDTSGISPYHTKYQFGSSRYNNIAELRRRPEMLVNAHQNDSESSLDEYDSSCVELMFGREVPIMAQQVPNAFVFRYETKQNKEFPFNSYMLVKYRCFGGYVFANAKAQALHCKEGTWVGEVPRCVSGSGAN